MRWSRSWSCLPWLLLAAGCFRFEALETPRPGMDVRARLTVEAAIRRGQQTDVLARNLDGSLVEHTADAVTIDVLIARSVSQFSGVELRDTVRLAMTDIEILYERRLSPARTALFTAALVAGAALIVTGVSAAVGGNEGAGDNGGNPAILVPVWSLQWPPGVSFPSLPFR